MTASAFSSRRGILWIAGLLLVAAIGCITIPLGDPEKSKIDNKLVGLWMGKPEDSGKQTMFSVVAYDSRTYFVSEFEFTKADDKIAIGSRMDWKVWLTDVGGQTFATSQIIDPRTLIDDDTTDEKYAVMKIALSGDTLGIQMVDDTFVKDSNVKNAQELQDLIAKNLANPKLFDGDSTSLTRMTAAQKDQAKDILAAFTGK